MLNSKKNKLLEVIKDSGIEPRKFRGDDSENTETSDFVISLIDSPLKFKVITLENDFNHHATIATRYEVQYRAVRWPGNRNAYSGKWSEITTKLSDWLRLQVQRYLDEKNTPDLWEELNSWIPSNVGSLSVINHEPFTDAEKNDIVQRIESYRKELLEKFDNDAAQQEIINSKLDYLKDAADRQKRSDWVHTAIGVFASLIFAMNINTNTDDALKKWIVEKSKPIVEQLIQDTNPPSASDSESNLSGRNSASPEALPSPAVPDT